MARPTLKSTRGLIDILGMIPRAARVANAVENGRKPHRSDLEALGIEDAFSSK